MIISFTPDEAAEIIRQHVLEKYIKSPKSEIRAAVWLDRDGDCEVVKIQVWDEDSE